MRSILPPNLDNLVVPVCLSASHVGWGAIRLEPTWIHISESAAWCCVVAKKTGVAPAEVDPPGLQRVLLANGVMLSFFNEFDVNCPEKWVQAVQYFGCRGFFSCYDARSHDSLDEYTARIWISAIAGMNFNDAAALALARRIETIPGSAEKAIVQEFVQAAVAQLFPAGNRSLLETRLTPQANTDTFITRAAACSMLFELGENLSSPPAPKGASLHSF